jgi:hypothetical protein
MSADRDTAGVRVPNQAFVPVSSHGWIPWSDCRYLHSPEHEDIAQEDSEHLDRVPVMSATVLGLDMLLHEPCIDLRLASDLVLSDVGATIKVLRLISREYDFVAERPSRMGECLASLDVDDWFGAISAQTFPCDRDNSATTAVWKHCRLVAQYAQLVAESLDDVSPEDAYLVGLLHEIETIPTVLGWPNLGPGTILATEGSLPLFVLAAMGSVNDSCSSSTWRFILTAAHELADNQTEVDAFAFQNEDSMGRA